MKKIMLCICLFASLVMTSQEKKSFEKEIFKISKKIDFITKAQKDSLKVKVIAIESKLQKGEITKTKAAILKSEMAMYHAKQIEIKVGAQEILIQQLVQDKANGKIASSIKEASGDTFGSSRADKQQRGDFESHLGGRFGDDFGGCFGGCLWGAVFGSFFVGNRW